MQLRIFLLYKIWVYFIELFDNPFEQRGFLLCKIHRKQPFENVAACIDVVQGYGGKGGFKPSSALHGVPDFEEEITYVARFARIGVAPGFFYAFEIYVERVFIFIHYA